MTLKLKNKQDTDYSDSIGLLISILVRYPEVGTINFDPKQQDLKFTFIFSRVLDEKELANFKSELVQVIETYNYLEGKEISIADVNHQFCDNFTMLEVRRDVNTLTQDEIALIIDLVDRCFKQNLVADQNEYMMEEDLIMQEELIEHMLENLKSASPERNLIAFREEGRVLVFNK
ncbi:MAG: hypothetical protein ACOY4Q_01505 [Bacillota bacterium]